TVFITLSLHDALPIFCPEDPENLCANNPCAIGEVLICHARNNGTFIEMCVRENQLQRHLDHGDTLGTCATFAKTETPHLNLYPRSEEHTSELQSRENL